ncbi:MAG: HypC/HybG/HupF family hydrogenase formation chaperone [Candidatus Hydrogenedentes bacterium]|nr:HypC/HybG/HupF family hydrogenase formation chaperone [Candidatus Hydrogenedentota bacterium]
MCLAVPGRILSITDTSPLTRRGLVDFEGLRKEIALSFVPGAGIGAYVLVHAGIAINTIDESEARRVFAWLHEINEIDLGAEEPEGP